MLGRVIMLARKNSNDVTVKCDTRTLYWITNTIYTVTHLTAVPTIAVHTFWRESNRNERYMFKYNVFNDSILVQCNL